MLPAEYDRAVGPLEPREPETLWSGEITYHQAGLPPAQTRYFTFALHDPDGERLGWAILYLPAAPATIVSLITRGNQGMFARMAELLEPARHETAILFADIQASSALARRLSTQRWFELIREFSTFADQHVIANKGIVGRHAGDGVTAFFLAEQVGSRAAACAAALHAGREIVCWRPEELGGSELHINAGVHWGGALYLGQVVTGGRLEVTALGDEVNECARIQQSARDGALLASKPVVERLDLEDAHALGLDPLTLMYRTVGELPGVTPKAVRDAGGVPVVSVPRHDGR
jgi:class 3 adenylate cyclase